MSLLNGKVYEILEGQTRKFRAAGVLEDSVTDTIPEGFFLKRGSSGEDHYDAISDTTAVAPMVYLNLVSTDRADAVVGGVAVLKGPYEAKFSSDCYDATATFAKDDAITAKVIGTSVSGIIALATTGDYIYGWVVEAPSASNGYVLRVQMVATNDGVKA